MLIVFFIEHQKSWFPSIGCWYNASYSPCPSDVDPMHHTVHLQKGYQRPCSFSFANLEMDRVYTRFVKFITFVLLIEKLQTRYPCNRKNMKHTVDFFFTFYEIILPVYRSHCLLYIWCILKSINDFELIPIANEN